MDLLNGFGHKKPPPTKSGSKRCAACGHPAASGSIQCEECGCGTFAVTRTPVESEGAHGQVPQLKNAVPWGLTFCLVLVVGLLVGALIGRWIGARMSPVLARDYAIFGGFWGTFVGFFICVVYRSRSLAKIDTPTRTHVLNIPYCSPACEELSAKTLVVAWLNNQSGPCTFCRKSVQYGRGHSTLMFPYRNQKAFVCPTCLARAHSFMAGVRECCLCGKPLSRPLLE